jgi:uncharacterized protein YoxC
MILVQTFNETIKHKGGTQTAHPIAHFTLNVVYLAPAKSNVPIASIIGEVADNTDGIEENTDEIANNTNEIVNNTNEILNSTNEVVNSTNEIMNSTNEIVSNTNKIPNMDEIKCSGSATSITCIVNTENLPQGSRWHRIFENGSLRLTRLQTITPPVRSTIAYRPRRSSETACSRTGCQVDLFCGSMANVRQGPYSSRIDS